MNKFVITIAVRNANHRASTIQIGKSDPNFQLPISYIERALNSARQNYSDYRIIIRDDASTDGTPEVIQEVIKGFDVPVDFAVNDTRIGVVANHYQMAQLIDDDEIIVILDGDDQLFGTDVLNKLDEVYSDPSVWITYGSFGYDECSRSKEPGADWRGFAGQMNVHDRTGPFGWTHLRTYKRWLFDRIRVEDLKFNGDFYQWICDHVTMYPMIEMAGPEHARYIHDILYLYNYINPYNEIKGPGAWPTDTEEQRRLKEEGEKVFGHSHILVNEEVDQMIDYFKAQPIYPLLKKEKDYPWM